MKTARQIALEALNKMEHDHGYSNIILDKRLLQGNYSAQEKSLASILFYGVLERKITLDYCMRYFSKLPFHKISKEVRNILRLGLYQLLYLDSIDEYAAVNETVNLCNFTKNVNAKAFVNGLLRSFLRADKQYPLPDKEKQSVQYYSVRYSCPEWLITQWADDYGWDQADIIVQAQVEKPPISIRVNNLRITADALQSRFKAQGIDSAAHKKIDDCIQLAKVGSVRELVEYKEGLFHVQDGSSQLCAQAAAYYAKNLVYDLCAAPGGKTFTIAEMLDNQVSIKAFDLHSKRVRLIQQGARRLGLSSVEAQQGDALSYNSSLAKADVVLVDAPCSGFGIIRRKPEIKYKERETLEGLPQLQLAILRNGAKYVETGGTLLYSTCTLSKKENERVASAFLDDNTDFIPRELPEFLHSAGTVNGNMVTLFPNDWDMDGFFLSAFQKIR